MKTAKLGAIKQSLYKQLAVVLICTSVHYIAIHKMMMSDKYIRTDTNMHFIKWVPAVSSEVERVTETKKFTGHTTPGGLRMTAHTSTLPASSETW